MAVFTEVSPTAALKLLQRYDRHAELIALEPIGAGIENTNYFVEARLFEPQLAQPNRNPRRLVLTLFEAHNASEVEDFAAILAWWRQQGFPAPAPLVTLEGHRLTCLHHKPTLLTPCLPGTHLMAPAAHHCQTLGTLLGRMHQVAPQAPFPTPVRRDLAWMNLAQARLHSLLEPQTAARLADEIDQYAAQRERIGQCPQGLVHGDLFRDNVLFQEGRISGLIDFYHSSRDTLLFDLAVVALDWCRTPADSLDSNRLQALLDGYQDQRPWSPEEVSAWPHLLRLAALRFWIARLLSRFLPGYQQRSRLGNPTKDPAELERLLVNLRG